MLNDELPPKKGVYALCLRLEEDAELNIGALGEVHFPAGNYIYIGSAFGPGGVRARLGRHIKGYGNAHWHIDSLRRVARVVECWYFTIDQVDRYRCQEASQTFRSYECQWSQALAAFPLASMPAPGFGSSDCRSGCASHLLTINLPSDPSKHKLIKYTLVQALANSIHIEAGDIHHFPSLSDKGNTPEVKWDASYL